MALINHNICRRKCHIFVRFRFSCTNFGGHLKRQSFKTSVPVVYTQMVSDIEHFQKVLTQVKHAKGKSDILIDMVILILFCRSWGCAPLSTTTDRLIWTALSAPERYCHDITTIK